MPGNRLKTWVYFDGFNNKVCGKGREVIKIFLKNLMGNQASSNMLQIISVPIDDSTCLSSQSLSGLTTLKTLGSEGSRHKI